MSNFYVGSKRLCVAKQDEMDDDEAEPEFTCENPNKRQRQVCMMQRPALITYMLINFKIGCK